jgi:predicted GNAT superfamily acetyltransferase
MIRFETPRGVIELRELSTIAEMEAAEDIQRKVWGADVTPTPKDLLIPMQHEGAFLAGAFAAGGEMIGLVFSFPTREAGVHHSHMLATLEEWRGLGIGTKLKWYQRDWCLQHGIEHVHWTVDPLRAANAELNIRHLGGVASQYLLNYYGAMQGIDAGVPSDRLRIEWHLSSPRVIQRAKQAPSDCGFPEAVVANEVDLLPQSPQVLIRLPKNFIELSKTDRELALKWRMQTRALFLEYFSRGYKITEFTRVGGPAYLLEP